jgi:HPt (histidine-containing phosphotransfer) domain-containing protein
MNLKECYDVLGGNYESVTQRLMNEKIVSKFVIKFLSDDSFNLLNESIKEKKYNVSFRAAHTIKGICQNLDFTRLFESSNKLTELLRSGVYNENEIAGLFNDVERDYNITVSAIEQFRNSNNL